MKRIVFCLLFLAIVVQDLGADSLNVMSWNIRYNNPSDGFNAWSNRKEWVAEIISQNSTDIAGFQEVLVGQLEDLKKSLPEMETYGVGRDDGKNGGEFSPIFYRRDRFELLEKSTFWLSPTPDKIGSKGWDAALPRIASWIKLKDRQSGVVFCVINTHFDHRGATARTESAGVILKQVREQFVGLPVILTGDFNTIPGTPPYDILIGKGAERDVVLFFDTFEQSAQKPLGPNSTWNGFEAIVPNRRIDFVFTTRSLKINRFQILEDQREGRFPSDHLPVITELELAKE